VYAPGTLVPGEKMPVLAPPPGAAQVPPTFGVPPKEANKLVAGLLMQSRMELLVPAFGGCWMVTLTVELTLTQGGGTVMV
jgi:hypothetical protein